MITIFRHAAWDTPWWVTPNTQAGRWNTPHDAPTQYWALHPAGVTAEAIRGGMPADGRLTLWAAQADLADTVRVHFDTSESFGLSPTELVADDLRRCQRLAAELRATDVRSIQVPSAALPGVDNLVFFGARVAGGYLTTPQVKVQVPTAKVLLGPPLEDVSRYVRQPGEPHQVLDHWEATGELLNIDDLNLLTITGP